MDARSYILAVPAAKWSYKYSGAENLGAENLGAESLHFLLSATVCY